MIGYPRPNRTAGYAEAVRSSQEAARNAVLAGNPAAFPDLWAPYRIAFLEQQKLKCGFCEALSVNHPGHVEHYAPKGEVRVLTRKGREVGYLNVSGRSGRRLTGLGYWWLAYEWDNWLYACERCNSGWKRNFFPVEQDPHPAREPATAYTPLLLHPFGNLDPEDHLQFTEFGAIAARNGSAYGTATIATCGLDRGSLVASRLPVAQDACRYIDRLLSAISEGVRLRALDAAGDLRQLGGADRPFSGVVRSLLRDRGGVRWTELPKLIKSLE